MVLSDNELKQFRELIRKGETLELEFKDDQKNFSDTIIQESVVAMTNATGGSIIVGITNNNAVVGCRRIIDGTWKSPEAVAGMIMAHSVPACATAVSIIAIDNKDLLLIRVPKSPTTTGTKNGKFLKRILDAKGNPQNIPMTADDIVSGVSRVGVQDFSSTVLADTEITDLDLNLVEEVAKRRATQVTDPYQKELLLKSPKEILSATALISFHEGKPNIASILMFGKPGFLRERLPNHEIQYQVFGARGELLKNIPFSGPIAAIFPKLLELPELLRNSDEFRFRGSNVVIPEYPEDSRREALANAIVHRDYTLQPGTQIQLFEKELSIISPGAFPAGVNLSNLLSVSPTPRNRRLAEAMRYFGFVESSGRGVDYIFQGQARFGRPAPDYLGSDNHKVSVRLTGGKANLNFCRFVLSSTENPSSLELLLLNALFFQRDLTLEQLSKVIQRPESVTKEIMSKLQADRLIEMTSDRVTRYILKGSANHSAMKAVKPARLTPQQIEHFKSALLAELRRLSPNTLSTLADLVGLSPSQTRRLLVQLRESSKVEMLSSKKWKFKESQD